MDLSSGFAKRRYCCAGGNLRLIAALAQNLDIWYNARVQEVAYSEKGVLVKLPNMKVKCKYTYSLFSSPGLFVHTQLYLGLEFLEPYALAA